MADYATVNDLEYSDDDARDFYEALSPVWGTSHTRVLIDSQATKSDILNAISWMAANADADDTVLFDFSGHGAGSAFCPYDYSSFDSGISTTELSDALNAVVADKIVVILDICYAGQFRFSLSKNGRVLMLACHSNELSEETSRFKNGVFSYFLLKALSDFDTFDTNEDYELSAEEIAAYANQMTANYVGTQNPVLDDEFIGELALLAKFVFVLNINLPAGTTILTLDGVDYTIPPLAQLWIPGSSHTITVPEAVYVSSGTRYNFIGWNDGDNLTSRTISKGFFSASYDLEHLLNIISAIGDPAGAGWYLDGSLVDFSIAPYIELPDTRHIFTGWSGDFTGTSPTGSLFMDAPKTVTANWRNEYLLTLNSEYGTPAGAGWYDESESVNISVEPVQGFIIRQVFDGWSGDLSATESNTTVTMSGPKVITAMWHVDYMQLYILIVVILVVAGIITTTIILVRRRGVY